MILWISIIIASVLIDQLTKLATIAWLEVGEKIVAIPYLINFHHIKNTGAAWGMFSDSRWIFLVISSVAIIGLPIFLYKHRKAPFIFGFSLSLVIGGAIGKKNPIKMVGGALGSVYGAINVVSDLLSYSRLFGLGLTSGVIGLVMNELGMIMVDMMGPIGWVPAVIVFVGGHVFNLAINLLGAYVHDSRLQYIEFFGRFYDGSGRAFKPLGVDVKYTYLDN